METINLNVNNFWDKVNIGNILYHVYTCISTAARLEMLNKHLFTCELG